MEYICCYFDTQGFYFNDKFYPREFAVLSQTGASVFSVDHGLKFQDLSWYERRSAIHNIRNHHGLSFEAKRGVNIAAIKPIITAFYKANVDLDHFLVACKSKEAEAILKDFGIPRINLERLGASWKAFEGNPDACAFHVNPGKCSLNAVFGMKKWIDRGGKKSVSLPDPWPENKEEKPSKLTSPYDDLETSINKKFKY